MEPSEDFSLENTMQLVREAQGGDREAMENLFTRFAPRVRRIVAMRMGKSIRDFALHDDIAQEALLKAFQGLERFEERSVGTFRNWLSRCVETAIVDHFRHKNAQKRGAGKERRFSDAGDESLSTSIFMGDDPTPSAVARGHELEEKIEAALLRMDERYREVIVLNRLCGMSHAEIAETLGMGQEGTARQVCFRAMHKLKEMIGA